jgi:glycosyltransferase involved in cell wall biosynthesis
MSKLIHFDARWIANHGIGRFAREMAQSPWMQENTLPLSGRFEDIFSPLDPFRIAGKLISRRSWWLSPSYNCPIGFSARSIITVHDLMHIRYPPYRNTKNSIYYEGLVKPVCRQAPLVFTVSNFTKSEICEWANIPAHKVVVVPNGVHEVFSPRGEAAHWPWPYVFYIGDRKPHKNLPVVLEAFARAQLDKEVRLLLSGVMTEELAQLAERFAIADRLVCAGFIPEQNLPATFRSALAVMMPSHYEGFGLPALEAMACGTPAIVGNTTAMPEVVGEAGVCVNPQKIDDIAEALNHLLSDVPFRQQKVAAGLVQASRYNWALSRQKWDAALSELFGTPAASLG